MRKDQNSFGIENLNVFACAESTSNARRNYHQMASADPKDTQTADQDKVAKPEEDKHLDRDGGERQPTDQSSEK